MNGECEFCNHKFTEDELDMIMNMLHHANIVLGDDSDGTVLSIDGGSSCDGELTIHVSLLT